MSEDVKELNKLRAELGKSTNVTKIAHAADLNPQTVYAAFRGETSLNTIERVRKTLRALKEQSKTG